MKELKDLETYGTLISDMRKKGIKFTNNNVFSDDIKRFIELKRIKYHDTERCLIFFLDEEKYYRLLIHLDPDQPWALPKLDKPALIRTRFVKDKKKADLLKLEEQMRQKGFVLKDTNVFLTLDSAPVKELHQRNYQRSKKILEHQNFRIIRADYSYHDQIDALMEGQDMIKYYHIPYQTEDEIKAGFEDNNYVAIINENDELLAYTSGHLENGKRHADAMIIKDEYKLYGFAPLLFYYCTCSGFSSIRKTSVNLTNAASIKLHKKLGWKFTNKYMENWLLEQ